MIVCTLHPSLDLRKGVLSKSILEEGGETIQQELRKFHERHGPARIGSVVRTSGGNLHCKYLFHLSLPTWSDDRGQMLCTYRHMHSHRPACMCSHACAQRHAHTHTHMPMLACTHACMYTHTYTQNARTNTQAYIHACNHMHADIHTGTNTHTHMHTHTCMRTHMHSHSALFKEDYNSEVLTISENAVCCQGVPERG